MTFDAHKNFAISRVATAPSPATSGTSLVVDSGDGALFPAVPFNATISPDPTGLRPDQIADASEIVRVTGISTDTLTITRAQESTAARTVIIGDFVSASVTAKTLTDAESWTIVTKGSDESVASSTTPQDDDALFFATVNGAYYEVEIIMIYGSPAGSGTPDMKVVLGEDGTARGLFFSSFINTSETFVNATPILANQTSTFALGTITADRVFKIQGTYNAGGATFKVQWAQNTSGANATIVRAGSFLRYRRIV